MNKNIALYHFKLYISSSSIKHELTILNIKDLCEEYFKEKFNLEVIDIEKNSDLLEIEHIQGVPTLERILPFPVSRIIGDFSNKSNAIKAINLSKLD